MTRIPVIVLMLAIIGGGTVPGAVRAAQQSEVTKLADRVYAVTRREPLGLAVNANSLVVIGDSGVLVVDAQFTREATLETLAAVRSLTRLPVTHVVNTHWHDDHVAGNQVYRDSFPAVRFVMHANTRADFETLGKPNRDGTRSGAPPAVARYDRLLSLGLGTDSTPLVPGERESVSSALRIMGQYLREAADFRAVTDGPAVDRGLSIDLGSTRVELRWFGRGNTRGDLVAWLPRERIAATGDLLVWPMPFAFNSYPREWPAVLDSIEALGAVAIVPGHGPVMRDTRYLGIVRAALADVDRGVEAAIARGDSLAALRRTLTLHAHRAALTGGDPWKERLFERFFRGPAIAAAWQRRVERE